MSHYEIAEASVIGLVALLTITVFFRHFYRIFQDIRQMTHENAVKFAQGQIPEPGARPNLFLNKPCREHFGGITR